MPTDDANGRARESWGIVANASYLGGGTDPGGAPTPGGVVPLGAVAFVLEESELELQPTTIPETIMRRRIRFIVLTERPNLIREFSDNSQINSRISRLS